MFGRIISGRGSSVGKMYSTSVHASRAETRLTVYRAHSNRGEECPLKSQTSLAKIINISHACGRIFVRLVQNEDWNVFQILKARASKKKSVAENSEARSGP